MVCASVDTLTGVETLSGLATATRGDVNNDVVVVSAFNEAVV